MAVFQREEAAKKAIELVNTALSAGLLKEVLGCSFNNPEKSGKETAAFISGFILALTDSIAEL